MSALSKIKHIILFEMILIFFSSVVMSETAEKTNVALRTSQGDIIIELYSDKAPITVTNFLRHLDEGFYDGSSGGAVSELAPTGSTKTLSVGGKYAIADNADLSIGGSYSQRGDVLTGTYKASLTDSKVISLGAKIAFSF